MTRPALPPLALALLLAACAPHGAPVLDTQDVLDRQTWWDNRDWDWYRANIPVFESPDPDIDATYYYRWELVTKHLTYGSPETGYLFTEFIDRPFWSGAYGAISCPLGHQFYEVRWLKDRRYAEDYARYWFETPGAQPRSYSNWYGDALWAVYLVQGDTNFLRRVLPHMRTQYEGWVAEHWDSAHRMFRWDGMHDGMETNINSRLTTDEFAGADGYRPTLNSYLFGDAMAIARASALLGDSAESRKYAERAAALRERVERELWDPRRTFFLHQSAADERGGIRKRTRTYDSGPLAGNEHGREEIGFVPWQFNLPGPGYEAAWRFLMDTTYFAAPFGPTTVERGDPQFLVSPRCCVWSGNAWPYATTQTLVAMANLLNNYRQDVVTKRDYFQLLRTYTLGQRLDGRPYVAEAANPFTGSWDGHNTTYHSEHYFHSGYADLVITGLAGLRPRADDTLEVNPLAPDEWEFFALDDVLYHGHRVSVVWDRDGTRYRRGRGLMLFVDGTKFASAPRLQRLTAPLGAARPLAPVDRPVNFAVNNGGRAFPVLTASYSAPENPPFYAIDGNHWYHASPPNRWTALGSGHAEDTLVLDFGVDRPVEMVKLYFLDDSAGVRAPVRYGLGAWTGSEFQSIAGQRRSPENPAGHRANIITFRPVHTSKLLVVLTHRPGASSGLTEIEAWGHATLPLPEPTTPSRNVALNVTGAGFPRVSASFTSTYDRLADANDGRVAFTAYSRNRWTAYGSTNAADWVEVDFGRPETVSELELYLWGDGRGVKAPRNVGVRYWDGEGWPWARIRQRLPAQPRVSAVNTLRIDRVTTTKMRVVFANDLPAYSGMTELVIRSERPR